MDKKFTIEVHQGEDYIRFTVSDGYSTKEKEWQEKGEDMLKLLKQFLKGLV